VRWFPLSLPDTYRVVLLSELILIGSLYLWAIGRYLRTTRNLKDPALRLMRRGVLLRCVAIEMGVIVLMLAVISAFGRPDIGRGLFNLLIQIQLLLLFMAWLMVDRQRFIHVEAPERETVWRALEQMRNIDPTRHIRPESSPRIGREDEPK